MLLFPLYKALSVELFPVNNNYNIKVNFFLFAFLFHISD